MPGHFSSFSDFLNMGGHGLYVWISYGLAVIVLIFNIINPWLQKQQFFAEQKRRKRREQRAS